MNIQKTVYKSIISLEYPSSVGYNESSRTGQIVLGHSLLCSTSIHTFISAPGPKLSKRNQPKISFTDLPLYIPLSRGLPFQAGRRV